MRDDWKEKRREWSDDNKYNSFNSYKGLAYYTSHYVPIRNWFEGKGPLPPPIELSLDPANACNFSCSHCNAQRYLKLNPQEIPQDRRFMRQGHLKSLIDFISDWGVKAACIGGGGEPLMNRNAWTLPSYFQERGMESSYATNGSLINDQIAEEMMHCRWVGVSVDAGDRETYQRVHGVDYFDRVIENLRLLVKRKEATGSKLDVAYKFLIRPDNWQSLPDACELAQDIGVRDFHARPADLERKDFNSAMQINYDMEKILELLAACREMENGDFRVFTVMHKYNLEFKVQHNFQKCMASSLMLQACADGNVYVCGDHRIEPRFRLGAHYPNPPHILSFWGSDEHRQLLKSIDVDRECGRCTYGEYSRQIEETTMEDGMCLAFP